MRGLRHSIRSLRFVHQCTFPLSLILKPVRPVSASLLDFSTQPFPHFVHFPEDTY
jgi:hypothetical protein